MAVNNPRHGDAIIEQRLDALGNKKLVASIQFQRYLDELATLALEADEGTDSTDTDQIIAATNASFRAKLTVLSTVLLQLPNAIQEIQSNEALTRRLQAQSRDQEKQLSNTVQEIQSNQALIKRLQSQIRDQQKQISDLEQLIHVN